MTNFGKTALLISGLCLLVWVSVGCSEQKVTELKAEEQGDAEAQPNSGVMYDEGDAVARGGAAAVKRLRKAAEQGDAEAQVDLGKAYGDGEGVEEDDAEAVEWYLKATEQGDAEAQFNLGLAYGDGTGVEQDFVLAHMWWSLARAQGHEMAGETLDILVRFMTEEQIAEAQRKEGEWQEAH